MPTKAVKKKKNESTVAVKDDADVRILKAAEELFIERGFAGVSANDVCAKAGVPKGLIFYYFKNKQNLFNSVLDQYYAAQAEAVMAAVAPAAGGTVRDKVHAGVDAYIDFIEKNPGYPRLIVGEICSCSSQENLEKIYQHMKPLYGWGTAVFGELISDSGPFSARHVFLSVYGMIINYYTYTSILERLWDSDPMEEAAQAERRIHIHGMVDTFLDKLMTSKTAQ